MVAFRFVYTDFVLLLLFDDDGLSEDLVLSPRYSRSNCFICKYANKYTFLYL